MTDSSATMTGVIVINDANENYTISSDQTVASTDGTPAIYLDRPQYLMLKNHGSITASGSTDITAITGYTYPTSHSSSAGVIRNYGQISVSSQGFHYATALYFGESGPDLDNFGTITVSVEGPSAWGEHTFTSLTHITNETGASINVSAPNGDAYALYLENGGYVLNNGAITVTTHDQAYDIFDYEGGGEIINNGTLTATSTGSDPYYAIGYGIVLTDLSWRCPITNNGTITATIAVLVISNATVTQLHPFEVTNTGTINGIVSLWAGNDIVSNGGVINGEVILGAGSDFLDSRNGTINGLILGGYDGKLTGGHQLGNGNFDGNDTILAGNEDNRIIGDDGNDYIDGGGGNDQIYGDGGVNLYGDPNTTYPDNHDDNDTLIGGAGNDVLYGEQGADILRGGPGNDTLHGGTGVDTADYSDATGGVTVSLAITTPQAVGGGEGRDILVSTGPALYDDSIENLLGSPFDDRLTGSIGNNTLNGGAGNDTLNGGAGDDTLNGGTGSDTASYSGATSGVTVSLAVTTAQAVGGGQGSDTLVSIENLTGSSHSDTLTGNIGSNVISGGSGNDTISSGGGGTDTLSGGSGNDTFNFAGDLRSTDKIDGGSGTDTVNLDGNYASGLTFAATTMVNVEKLVLAAGYSYKLTTNNATVAAGKTLTIDGSALGASDVLTFNGAAETDGHFIIIGGLGSDKLTGGALSDTFTYTSAAQSTSTSYDTITGFNFSSDIFDIPGAAGTITAIDTKVTSGSLSTSSFDGDLATALAGLGAHHAVLFKPNSGTLSGDTFLVVDLNGTAGYQSDHDLVIRLIGSSGTLAAGCFH